MKHLLLLLVFLSACPAKNTLVESPPDNSVIGQSATHGKCAKSCDLSTDEKVSALYKELTGNSLEPVPRCVARSAAIPRAIVVGNFLSDLGCDLNGVFVDCCYSEIREPAALLDLGWEAKNTQEREALALQFTQDVVLAFDSALSVGTSDFGIILNGKTTPSFTPMSVASKADGSVTVEYWSKVSIGMMKPRFDVYEKWRQTFDAKGFLAKTEKIDTFEGKPFEKSLPLEPTK